MSGGEDESLCNSTCVCAIYSIQIFYWKTIIRGRGEEIENTLDFNSILIRAIIMSESESEIDAGMLFFFLQIEYKSHFSMVH